MPITTVLLRKIGTWHGGAMAIGDKPTTVSRPHANDGVEVANSFPGLTSMFDSSMQVSEQHDEGEEGDIGE